jgi:hypothetical protein
MNWEEIINFPSGVLVKATIKKVELKKQCDLTSSELKLIDSADVKQIQLIASINQPMANIEAYQDELEDYSQLYFIRVLLSTDKYAVLYKSIGKLIHQLLPHHCIVITQADDHTISHLSLATKRYHKQLVEQRVIEEFYLSESIDSDSPQAFLDALAYSQVPKQNLKVFDTYYIQALKNYALTDLTGEYVQRPDYVTDEYLQIAQQIKVAEEQIESYNKILKSTTQMSEKVALNTDIHALKEEIQLLKEKIN